MEILAKKCGKFYCELTRDEIFFFTRGSLLGICLSAVEGANWAFRDGNLFGLGLFHSCVITRNPVFSEIHEIVEYQIPCLQ